MISSHWEGAEAPLVGRVSFDHRNDPFVRALYGGTKALALVDSLLFCSEFEPLVEIIEELFVTCYGYDCCERAPLSRAVSPRITRGAVVAAVHGFEVSVIEGCGGGRWSKVKLPLVPGQGLVFLMQADLGQVRVYWQEIGSQAARSRALGAQRIRSDMFSDVFGIACRLDAFARREGDDREILFRRAERAMNLSSAELARDWVSIAWSEGASGGQYAVVAHELNLFFGGARDARYTGLYKVLDDHFPRVLPKYALRIDIMAVSISEEIGHEQALSCGETAGAVILFELSFETGELGAASFPLTLELLLPLPDEQGRFVLGGQTMSWRPLVGAASDDQFGMALRHLLARGLGEHWSLLFGCVDRLPGNESEVWSMWDGLCDAQGRSECDLRSLSELVECSGFEGVSLSLGSVSVEELPPPWACIECVGDLRASTWVPVAGAVLHPLGALALPFPGWGGTRLQICEGSVFDWNPRCGGEGAGLPLDWVARGLGPFADLDAGSVVFASSRDQLRGLGPVRVARVHADRLRVLSSPALLARLRRGQIVHHSETVPFQVGVEPSLAVAAMDRIEVGDVLLRVPDALTPNSNLPGSHACEILEQLGIEVQREGAADLRRVTVGLCGQLLDCRLELIRDVRGQAMHWYASFTIVRGRQDPGVCILSDGREVAFELLAPEEGWFDVQGHSADVLIMDPEFDASSQPSVGWQDSDAVLEGPVVELCDTLYWRLRERTDELGLADQQLRFSALDGRGLVSGAAASLSQAELLWWRLIDPAAAAASDNSLAAWTGGEAPWCFAWRDLMASFEGDEDGSELAAVESSARALEKMRNPAQRHLHCSCLCGELTGFDRYGEFCLGCEARSELRSRSVTPATCGMVELGCLVVHPWRRRVAAALLGLCEAEYLEFQSCCEPDRVEECLRLALASPLRSIQRRLEEAEDGLRSQLLDGAAALELELAKPGLSDRLWIRRVRSLPFELMPRGLPHGATGYLHGELLLRFGRIEAAAKSYGSLKTCSVQPILIASFLALCEQVGAYFGALLSEPGVTSLAALARRTWPLSSDRREARPDLVRVPGTFSAEGSQTQGFDVVNPRALASLGERSPDYKSRTALIYPQQVLSWDLSAGSERVSLASDQPDVVPCMPPYCSDLKRRPLGRHEYLQRRALVTIVDDYLTGLSALVLIGCRKTAVIHGQVGDALRGLGLGIASCHALDFLALLKGEPESHRLPKNKVAADKALALLLKRCLPGDDEVAFARQMLAAAMSGWWLVEPSFESSSLWFQAEHSPRTGARRALPPLAFSPWSQHQEWVLLGDPILAYLALGGRDPCESLTENPRLAALLGVSTVTRET